jgi:hypothetical protein
VRQGPHRNIDAENHAGVVSSIEMANGVSSWPGDNHGTFELLDGRQEISALDPELDLLRPPERGREKEVDKQAHP